MGFFIAITYTANDILYKLYTKMASSFLVYGLCSRDENALYKITEADGSLPIPSVGTLYSFVQYISPNFSSVLCLHISVQVSEGVSRSQTQHAITNSYGTGQNKITMNSK